MEPRWLVKRRRQELGRSDFGSATRKLSRQDIVRFCALLKGREVMASRSVDFRTGATSGSHDAGRRTESCRRKLYYKKTSAFVHHSAATGESFDSIFRSCESSSYRPVRSNSAAAGRRGWSKISASWTIDRTYSRGSVNPSQKMWSCREGLSPIYLPRPRELTATGS